MISNGRVVVAVKLYTAHRTDGLPKRWFLVRLVHLRFRFRGGVNGDDNRVARVLDPIVFL